MPRRKLTYKEGDWIAVTLRNGGYAIGIITRARKGGIALIGYFFGPRYEQIPTMKDVKDLKPSDAVLICDYGDLGLLNKTWSVIGHSRCWDRSEWPMPVFVRRDSITNKPSKIYYSEENPNTEVFEDICSEEEADELPEDGAWGYGAVEIKLSMLLNSQSIF